MFNELIKKIQKGDLETVKIYLDQGLDVDSKYDIVLPGPFVVLENGKTIYSATIFMAACAYGQLEIAKLIQEKGANIKYCNSEGYNAAHVAAFNGYPELVIEYLAEELKFNLSQKDKHGFDIFAAAGGGHIGRDNMRTVGLLNLYDNEVHQGKNYKNHDFGLLLAIEDNNLLAVKDLVKRRGHSFEVMAKGGGYSYGGFVGYTGYTYAKVKGYKNIVKFFDEWRQKKGVIVEQDNQIDSVNKNSSDISELNVAIPNLSLSQEPPIALFFVKQAHRKFLDAVSKGQVSVMKVLLGSTKYNIDVKNCNNGEPLYLAIKSGQFEAAKIILNHGAKVDTRHFEVLESSEYWKNDQGIELFDMLIDNQAKVQEKKSLSPNYQHSL